MMTYKDRTFCKYHEQCVSGKDCPRALTEDVMKGAEAYKLPLSVFAEHPWCYEPKMEEDN